MLTTSEIRRLFLEFFKARNHVILPSESLVPPNDPTLMFTNAGMVQFKDVFAGSLKPPHPRAATVQKCIRISGKHNDLSNVGRTSRHHTFFEMLGNFSFGDYFKKDACCFAWDLLTQVYGLEPGKLWITVFAGDENAPADEDAEAIWHDEVGVPKERIKRLGAKDNFWSMGETGPCGPCSEIHYDRGEGFGHADLENSERFFEIWNLVFMQYNIPRPGGKMESLPSPCIDTGAGLERIASVLQGVETNYEIDIFRPLVEKAAQIAGSGVSGGDSDTSLRVIADHARMAAFLIAEGVFPEKSGREYVLRRVIRRAIRHGHRLGIERVFFCDVASEVVDVMGDVYPMLVDRRDLINRVCRQEEERFRETLSKGLELLSSNSEWKTGGDGRRVLSGAIAFDLTATYGFPRDLIEVIGDEEGFTVDDAGYKKAAEKHKAISGAGKIGQSAVETIYKELKNTINGSDFVGYDGLVAPAHVLALVSGGATVESAGEGDDVEIILDRTPFYGESGGQVGDTGFVLSKAGRMRVVDSQVPLPGLFVHRGVVEKGIICVGEKVEAHVDAKRRENIRRHHTATHLLHCALRELLGSHATQKGSRVDEFGLRFDFAHFEPLSWVQIAGLEDFVAAKIRENHTVVTDELPFEEAREKGATALFGENYGDRVRMVTVSDKSVELCGGTHVSSSGAIGDFFVVGETGIAAGVRRIEAVAGESALKWIRGQREILLRAGDVLKIAPQGIPSRLESMLVREKELLKEIGELKRRLARGGSGDVMEKVRNVNGTQVLGVRLEVGDPGALRDTADSFCRKIGSGVVCLGGDNGGKAALVVAVSKDLTSRFHAGEMIKKMAGLVGGRGGGRPDFAQAGGPDVSKLDTAVDAIYDIVERATK